MKHALGQESKARRLAEHRYADEMRRRVDAEKTAAALSEQNRMLERETRAWATAAAETLVSSLESPQTAETGVPAIPSEEQAPIIPSVKLFTVPAVRHAASSSAISRSLPGNLKGKGRMLSWSPDVSPPDGSQTNVLQRAAGESRKPASPPRVLILVLSTSGSSVLQTVTTPPCSGRRTARDIAPFCRNLRWGIQVSISRLSYILLILKYLAMCRRLKVQIFLVIEQITGLWADRVMKGYTCETHCHSILIPNSLCSRG